MKNLLYTLGIFLLITSCKNIEKMVEKGQYDEAIAYATQKLAGKKNKKTKDIKALEKAFLKITDADVTAIKNLAAESNPRNWDRVFSLAKKIEKRQTSIDPFLPLVSKEGYRANFNFVNTSRIKEDALDGSAQFRYEKAIDHLALAKATMDKAYARKAYHAFEDIDQFRRDYKNSYRLKNEAYQMGQVNIKIEIETSENIYLPLELEDEMRRLSLGSLNSLWKNYYYETDFVDTFDFVVKLELNGIDVSPERETVTHHTDEKKIKVGWDYVKTKNGEFKLDSLGKKIKKEKFENVRAHITEIIREKSTFLNARMIQIDTRNRSILEDRPINVQFEFSDYALTFIGDIRAICEHDVGRTKDFALPFPNDLGMILDASEVLKTKFKNSLKAINI